MLDLRAHLSRSMASIRGCMPVTGDGYLRNTLSFRTRLILANVIVQGPMKSQFRERQFASQPLSFPTACGVSTCNGIPRHRQARGCFTATGL